MLAFKIMSVLQGEKMLLKQLVAGHLAFHYDFLAKLRKKKCQGHTPEQLSQNLKV